MDQNKTLTDYGVTLDSGYGSSNFDPVFNYARSTPMMINKPAYTDTNQQLFTNETTSTDGTTGTDISSLLVQNGQAQSNIEFPEFQRDPYADKAIQALLSQGVDIDTLTKRLIADSGTIASSQSDIDKYIGDAIQYQEKARQANVESVTSSFDSLKSFQIEKSSAEYADIVSSSLGGETSMYTRAYLTKQIDNSIKDLESRKQSAIAEGNANSYKTISDLQMKQLELRNKAVEDNFNRLVGISSVMEKKSNNILNIANIARNASRDELDYRIKKAEFELDRETSLSNQAYKAKELALLAETKNVKLGDLDKPAPTGWASFSLAKTTKNNALNGLIQLSTLMEQGKINPNTGEEVTYKSIYKALKDKAEVDIALYTSTGEATRNAVLESYMFSPEKGNPLVTPAGDRIYSDGTFIKKGEVQLTPILELQKTTAKPMSFEDSMSEPKKYSQIQGIMTELFGIPTAYADTTDGNKGDMLGEPVLSNDKRVRYVTYGDDRSFADKFFGLLSGDTSSLSSKITVQAEPIGNTTAKSAIDIVKERGGVINMPLPKYSSENLNSLLVAMSVEEGYFGNKGDTEATTSKRLPVVNNNPGNLRFAGQPGAVNYKGFARFKSPEAGWDALKNQIMVAITGQSANYSPNMTLLDFVKKYAPEHDNNRPDIYAKRVSERIGLPLDTRLSEIKEWVGLE